MLNFNQKKERENLQLRREELNEELAFAHDGENMRHYANWELITEDVACDAHGNYSRRTLISPEFRGTQRQRSSACPECVNDELAQLEVNLNQLRIADLQDDAGIARRFEHCEYSNYQPVNPQAEANLAACQRYSENWPKTLEVGTGLVMTGSCGTGKNHLAISIVKQIIQEHFAQVRITDVMRIVRSVKATWRSSAESTEEEVLDFYASLDLLIIDEVGVQFGTPAEMTILQEIINARYENVLPTILISNLTFDQLKGFIGERIVDRVTDGGRNRLTFNWPSYRGNAA